MNNQWQSCSHHSVKLPSTPSGFMFCCRFFWHLATSPGPSNAIVDAFFKNRWVFRTLNSKKTYQVEARSWHHLQDVLFSQKNWSFCRMFLLFLYKVYFLLNQLFVNFQGTITYPTKTGSSEHHRLKRTNTVTGSVRFFSGRVIFSIFGRFSRLLFFVWNRWRCFGFAWVSVFFGTCVAFSLASAVDGWCAPFLVKVCATFLCGDLVLWKR